MNDLFERLGDILRPEPNQNTGTGALPNRNNMEKLLQSLYEDALWYGHAVRKGRRYHRGQIERIAERVGITLTYYCPA